MKYIFRVNVWRSWALRPKHCGEVIVRKLDVGGCEGYSMSGNIRLYYIFEEENFVGVGYISVITRGI